MLILTPVLMASGVLEDSMTELSGQPSAGLHHGIGFLPSPLKCLLVAALASSLEKEVMIGRQL